MADEKESAEVRAVGVLGAGDFDFTVSTGTLSCPDAWGPTNELRWMKGDQYDPKPRLQQRWASWTGKSEWRDVPMVSEP